MEHRQPDPPRYGSRSVAEVAGALLDALAGRDNGLGIPGAARGCLLLIDGLGSDQLQDHADLAPTLAGLRHPEPLDAACPTTTVTSLASLMTGCPPGSHGLLGATLALPDERRPMSLLKWRLHGVGDTVDLTDRYVPEDFQPVATVLQRAADAGLDPVSVGPAAHAGTGLNRALLRGAPLWPATGTDEIVELVNCAMREHRFVYAYYGLLDAAGHHGGVDSRPWREQLLAVDRLVERLTDGLPSDAVLAATSDHGMLDVPGDDLYDIDREPTLLEGVRVVAGEPRFRHVHVDADGDREQVRRRWARRFADDLLVASREQAIAAGWFGPVDDRHRDRIGDVVAVSLGTLSIVQKTVDPLQADLRGHHGALTPAERYVPLLLADTRPGG